VPYRHAHWWLLLLFPLTGLAFWRGYFSQLGTAPYALHVHGVTASLWIGLLVFQSWSIHGRRNGAHRQAGYASFALFPLFSAGGLLVIQTMAAKFEAQSDPFYNVFGARLAAIDLISTLAILHLFFMAMKYRRKVHLHARYMLGTVFFLLAPILGRIAPAFPPLAITGPQDFHRFAYGLHLSHALVLALLFHLYRDAPKHGRPFATIGVLIVGQSLVFETLAGTAAWESVFTAIGAVPTAALASIGLAAAAAVAWAGWTAGSAQRRAVATG
jgi:hypothetical protein